MKKNYANRNINITSFINSSEKSSQKGKFTKTNLKNQRQMLKKKKKGFWEKIKCLKSYTENRRSLLIRRSVITVNISMQILQKRKELLKKK